MKTVFEHIEHVKGKPHHVRRRVAFAAAMSGAAIVALVWLVGSFSLGTFALQENSFADAVGQGSIKTTDGGKGSPSVTSGIAGVAAVFQTANTPASIEIIDTVSSTYQGKKAEQTTIPF